MNSKLASISDKERLLDVYSRLSLLRKKHVAEYKIDVFNAKLGAVDVKEHLLQVKSKLKLISQYEVCLKNKDKEELKLGRVDTYLKDIADKLSRIKVCPTCGTHLEKGIKCS
ncbi:MAG: hypothetical protein EOM67_15700 [Spirochaetia bacterium]|nr:hypothetical protein [Spirochaetia bacterium]